MSAALQLYGQMKMAAGLTRDIKCQVSLSFDSAAQVAEEISINVSQFISVAAVC